MTVQLHICTRPVRPGKGYIVRPYGDSGDHSSKCIVTDKVPLYHAASSSPLPVLVTNTKCIMRNYNRKYL